MPVRIFNTLLFQALPGERGARPERGSELPAAWANALKSELASRTRGDVCRSGIVEDESERVAFTERYAVYLNEFSGAAIHGHLDRELPVFVYRMLCALAGPEHAADVRPRLIEPAFRHAEILRERHIRLSRQLKESRVFGEMVDLAFRIRDKIRMKQPVKLRTLVRSFDKQRTALYLPVLDKMVKAGLIAEEPRGIYRIRRGGDLEGSLRRVVEQEQSEEAA